MSDQRPNTGTGPVLSRAQVIDALSEHFAADHIEVEELERRLDVAHRAESHSELRELLSDLPALGASVPATVSPGAGQVAVPPGHQVAQPYSGTGLAVAAEHEVRDTQVVVGFWGGAARKGSWVPARIIHAVAVMGGVELDFRDARLGPGGTTLRAFAVMGGIDVIVPPGMRVECDGIGIMGAFEHSPDPHSQPDPNGPLLRITGVGMMGGVDVTVRQPGETAGDARRRRRAHRRELKAAARRRRLGK